jgi:transcriptional regulator with XRE-family HTH domain
VGQPAFRGDRLAEARRAAGLTQAQLAEAVGVSDGLRVSQWERGSEQPRPRFVPALAAVLGVGPLELLDVDPADPPLRALRLAAGLSLPDVQAAAAVPVMTYQRLERGVGTTEPPDGTVTAVAAVLGVSPGRVRAAVRRARSDRP